MRACGAGRRPDEEKKASSGVSPCVVTPTSASAKTLAGRVYEDTALVNAESLSLLGLIDAKG